MLRREGAEAPIGLHPRLYNLSWPIRSSASSAASSNGLIIA